jgi:hypothetical protein
MHKIFKVRNIHNLMIISSHKYLKVQINNKVQFMMINQISVIQFHVVLIKVIVQNLVHNLSTYYVQCLIVYKIQNKNKKYVSVVDKSILNFTNGKWIK